MSDARLVRKNRLLLLVLLGAAPLGCATAEMAVTEPPVTLTVSVDRDAYKIGDPLIAAIGVKNDADDDLVLTGLSHETLQFTVGSRTTSMRVQREPVRPEQLQVEPRELKPGESYERRFVFTRATEEEGECVLLVSFRGAAVGGKLIDQAIYAVPASYRVTDEVGLKRDPGNGMILKEQAVEIAAREAGIPAEAAKAVLVPLGGSGLATWVIMMREKAPDGTEVKRTVQVDPYLGTVRPVRPKSSKANGSTEMGATNGDEAGERR